MFNLTATGRLTADPELRYTAGGTAICTMSIATSRYAGKEKGQVTDYLDITTWGKMAENHAEHLGKGHLICATGDLTQQRWEKDGSTRSKHVLSANNIEYLQKPTGEAAPEADSADEPF